MIFVLAVIGVAVACIFALVTIAACGLLGIPPSHDLLLYGGLACLAAGELVTFAYGLWEL